MRIQRNTWSCGPMAIINSLDAQGIKVTEKQVLTYSGTTKKDGTNQFGILSVFAGLNIPATEYKFNPDDENEDEIYAFIIQYLVEEGKSFILDFYKGAHWVAVVGAIGDRVVVWDSDFGPKNKKRNGTYTLSKKELFKKWTPNNNEYYLIVVNYDNKA